MFTNRDIEKLSNKQKKRLLKKIYECGEEYGIFPLSAEQERMWFLYSLDKTNPYYNAIVMFDFEGAINISKISECMKRVIDHNSVFRTIFINLEGSTFQSVCETYDFEMSVYNLRNMKDDEVDAYISNLIMKEYAMSFDLEADIPIKCLFIQTGENRGRMLVKMHHICFDGWSLGIMVTEFKEAYYDLSSDNLLSIMDENKHSYVDYAVWQRKIIDKNAFEQSIRYWKNKLSDRNSTLSFNFENKLEVPTYNGAALEVELTQEEVDILNFLAGKYHTSFFVITLSLYCLVLTLNTNESSLQIGTPTLNRTKPEYENIIGFFANTLVINADIDFEESFEKLILQVKDTVVNALEHQDVPFDIVVNEVGAKRCIDMSPLFQVMFSVQNNALVGNKISEKIVLNDTNVLIHTLGTEYVDYIQYKMIFTIIQSDKKTMATLGYNKDLFPAEYMQNILQEYKNLIKVIDKCITIPLKELPLNTLIQMPRILSVQKQIVKPLRYLRPIYKKIEPYNVVEEDIYNYALISDSFKELPPGMIGHIIIKEKHNKNYFFLEEQGYWSYDGKLILVKNKEENFIIGDHEINVSDIEMLLLQEFGTEFKVFTTASKEYPIVSFYIDKGNQLSEDIDRFLKDKFEAISKILYYPLNYFPTLRNGCIDNKRLYAEVITRLIEAQTVKTNLLKMSEVIDVSIGVRNNEEELLESKKLYNSTKNEDKIIEEVEETNISQLCGGNLDELPFLTLSDLLEHTCKVYGDKVIRVIQYKESEKIISYSELWEDANRIANSFANRKIKAGSKIIIMTNNIELFIKALWGCIIYGAIPVPLGMAIVNNGQVDATGEKFNKVYKKLKCPLVLGSSSEQANILELGEALCISINTYCTVEELFGECDIKQRYNYINQNDTAIILFTSGTTGMPKGVELSHRNILKRSQAVTVFSKQHNRDISLNWMPLDHVGGVVMFHIRDVFGGIEQIQVETSEILRDPTLWMEYINRYRVSLTWAPNFAYDLFINEKSLHNKHDWDLSCLRFILNGGEFINEKSSLAFLLALKQYGLSEDSMFPSWGMSETSSGVLFSEFFGKRNYNGYVEVGEPIPGNTFRIVDADNKVVPQGVIGSLQIKGETVTKGYYENLNQNQKSYTRDGWFITGDLAIMNNNQITLTGRNSNLIIINGLNYASTDIELTCLDNIEELTTVAACSVHTTNETIEKLIIFFITPEGVEVNDLKKDIKNVIYLKHGLEVKYSIPLSEDEIPRGALGKIQRKQLSKQFEQGYFDTRIDEMNNGFRNWFYYKKWDVSLRCPIKRKLEKVLLLFIPNIETKEFLEKHLDKDTKKIWVIPSDNNSVSKTILNLDYKDLKSYKWLWQSITKLVAEKKVEVIHLWGYDNDKETFKTTQYKTIYSLKEIFKAGMSNLDIKNITVVTNGVYSVGIHQFDINKSTMIGFLRSARSEMEFLIRHIDFEKATIKDDIWIILDEIKSVDRYDISYRNDIRMVPKLKRIELTEFDNFNKLIRQNGYYVIIGGLGNIGIHLAQYLFKQYNARLLIIGRTNLETNLVKKLEYSKLCKQGYVDYQAIDICDYKQLLKIIEVSEKKYCQHVEGFFNLAGGIRLDEHYKKMSSHLIVNENIDNYEQMFAVKVKGTNNIIKIAEQRDKAFIINFASSNGFFGGNSFSAYSAANSYVNSVPATMKRDSNNYITTIEWSIWDTFDTKTAKESAIEASNAKGFLSIEPKDGMHSMECVIQRRLNNVLVGIDGSNKNMNIAYHTGEYANKDIFEIYYSTNCANPIALTGLTYLPLRYSDKLIIDNHGYIDYSRIEKLNSVNKYEEKLMSPQHEKMKEIWEEVLGHGNIGLDDKFFEVGGNSIKTIQLVSAINNQLNCNIEIADLFKYTSIRAITLFINEEELKDINKNETIALTF